MSSSSLARVLKSLCISGSLAQAVDILCQGPVCPGPGTYALLLQECVNRKDAKLGKRIHSRMITTGFSCNIYICTKLLIFYAKIGDVRIARYMFDSMPQRGVVAWNAMISGYVRSGMEEEGLGTYRAMRAAGVRPDQFTFASVLCACARLAVLEHGQRAHGVMVKCNVAGNLFANCALVDMYLKCSSPNDAHQVFRGAPERNVTMWTALVSGYGQHGRVGEALALFGDMTRDGFWPNHVTFLAVLSACAHGGLVDEAMKHFSSMSEDYGIQPRGEHYAAVVDALARAGRVQEAYEVVKNLPDCQEHSVIWGALLGGCRKHGDLKLVRLAAEAFFRLQPANAGKYVVLANTYAACKMWESVASTHDTMRALDVRKDAAWSAVEVQGEKHTFLAGDACHEECPAIYEVCNALASAVTEQTVRGLDSALSPLKC